jgi:hypothetical protein
MRKIKLQELEASGYPKTKLSLLSLFCEYEFPPISQLQSHAIKTKRLIKLVMNRMDRMMKIGQSTVTQGQPINPSTFKRIFIVKHVTVSFIMYQNYNK